MYKTRDGDVCYEVHEMPRALRARGFHDAAETWELEDERCGVMCACGDFNCSDMMGPYCTFRGVAVSNRFAVRKEREVSSETAEFDAEMSRRGHDVQRMLTEDEWTEKAVVGSASAGTPAPRMASLEAQGVRAPASTTKSARQRKTSGSAVGAASSGPVCLANTVTTNKSIAHRCTRRAIAGSDFCKTHAKVGTPLVTSSDWDERPDALNDGDDPFDFD